jgi:hypothetical protein
MPASRGELRVRYANYAAPAQAGCEEDLRGGERGKDDLQESDKTRQVTLHAITVPRSLRA